MIHHLLLLVSNDFCLKLIDGRVLLPHGVVGLHDAPDVGQLLGVHLLLKDELLLSLPLFLEIILDDVRHAHILLSWEIVRKVGLIEDLGL